MKFKRIIKRKVYPTWVSTKRLNGCLAYVFQVPREKPYYHFQIVCENDVKYASLVDDIKFEKFEDVCEQAEKWIITNIIN
jgi:hypothetical protein